MDSGEGSLQLHKSMSSDQHYWSIIRKTIRRFTEIDGDQRAAAFGYYGLISLFPFILLLVTALSYFVDRETAVVGILGFVNDYIPGAQERENLVIKAIKGVIHARTEVGLISLAVLVWSALKFLKVLIRSSNRAWNSPIYRWWRLPLRSLSLLGVLASAFLIGILVPAGLRILERHLSGISEQLTVLLELLIALMPTLVLFYSLSMLYRLAPSRKTSFAEVWLGALAVTSIIRIAEMVFAWYTRHLGHWNSLYGGLGGIAAFLMWVYISGWIFVMGACFCASLAEIRLNPP